MLHFIIFMFAISSYAYTAKEANEISTKQHNIRKKRREAYEIVLLKSEREKTLKAIKKASRNGCFVVYTPCNTVYNKNGEYFRELGYKIRDVMGVCSISWE